MRIETSAALDELDWDKGDGLLPMVVQDALDGAVLMLGWASREAAARSVETGQVHFWSRTRERLWRKGETSGNVLTLVALHADCDRDTLLALGRPAGPTCHTGRRTCFLEADSPPEDAVPLLAALDSVLADRQARRPADSYTARLLGDRNLRLKKLGEETAEVVVAAAREDGEALAAEAADLLYHLLVACRAADVDLRDLLETLERRRG